MKDKRQFENTFSLGKESLTFQAFGGNIVQVFYFEIFNMVENYTTQIRKCSQDVCPQIDNM